MRYRGPDDLRSAAEIAITFVPLAALWTLAWAAVHFFGYWWLSFLLAVPAAGFLVRLFMIQHDCGHGSFFRHRIANDWVGRAIGVLTLTPYDFWRRTHAVHHASFRSSGTARHGRRRYADGAGISFAAVSGARLRYRAYRHPLVMFGIGPAYLFILQYRLPVGLLLNGWRPWLSTMATNVAHCRHCRRPDLVHRHLALSAGAIAHHIRWRARSASGCSMCSINSRRHSGRMRAGGLSRKRRCHGSSYYDLPAVLRWFTANIGVHHVHHLCSRIPYYRLPRVLRDHPELRGVSRLTLLQSFQCVRLVLWDESRQRLVSFGEI